MEVKELDNGRKIVYKTKNGLRDGKAKVYQNDKKIGWFYFKEGKVTKNNRFSYFSGAYMINGKRWYFDIEDNKILKAGTGDVDNLNKVVDGKVKGHLINFDPETCHVTIEGDPEPDTEKGNSIVDFLIKALLSDSASEEWMNIEDGKVTKGERWKHYSARTKIDEQIYCFDIEDNKFLRCCKQGEIKKMVPILENGDCPAFGLNFTLDLPNKKIISKPIDHKVVLRKETDIGYTLYYGSSGKITKKEIYKGDKKIKEVNYLT